MESQQKVLFWLLKKKDFISQINFLPNIIKPNELKFHYLSSVKDIKMQKKKKMDFVYSILLFVKWSSEFKFFMKLSISFDQIKDCYAIAGKRTIQKLQQIQNVLLK